ncbi:MAG: choice-of-anchor B family protein [Schleiferiaceae bacterium]|nr:choice-of-anchor B family protein [Schleiferiaceae bacterium]
MLERNNSHFFLIGALLLLTFSLLGQDHVLHTQKLGHLAYSQELNDIWGWTDTNGREFALVGTVTGFSVAEVTDPTQPVERHFIPGATSIWRDIKTFGNYAYVVHDVIGASSPMTGEGILIVDLTTVDSSEIVYTRFQPTIFQHDTIPVELQRAHNLYIDEVGRLFLFGSNYGIGGVLIFDLNNDPAQPELIGVWDDYYVHDGYSRGDTLWIAAIHNGFFAALDVSRPEAPLFMAQRHTPAFLTHNIWPSDDGKYVFTTDETSGARVMAYDVQNLSNIRVADRIRPSYQPNAVPHNVHVYRDYLITSYYTAGLHITDASIPENLIEIGYYDTSPLSSGKTEGAWGAYPFLPSENILVTDIEEGLFVIAFDFVRGAHFFASTEDSLTGDAINNAHYIWKGLETTGYADIAGKYKYGHPTDLLDTLVVWKQGFQSREYIVSLQAGQRTDLAVRLLPEGYIPPKTDFEGFEIRFSPNPASGGEIRVYRDNLLVKDKVELFVYDIMGQLVLNTVLKGPQEEPFMTFPMDLSSGTYTAILRIDQQKSRPTKLIVIPN